MKMKEVCERTALTERTVRFYMQKGLIAPQKEWRNGREYSEFSENDIETLQAVAILRELTFSIEDIRTMQTTPELIAEIVAEKRDAARISHESAENTFSVLDHLNTDGIESMMMLAERARDAAVHRPHDIAPEPPEEVNQSGMGDRCEKIPHEITDKWNWGAFWTPWIWGIANHVYQAFLCMIPIFGIFYAFYLGKNGNELAWKHRYWESVDVFRKTQRRWAIWTTVISVLILALYVVVGVVESNKDQQHEIDESVLRAQLMQTEEWHEIVGSRTEWTEEMAIAAENEPAEGSEAWEIALNEYLDDLALDWGDPFYGDPKAYYRILWDEYYIPDQELIQYGFDEAFYYCEVDLSNGESWTFDCEITDELNMGYPYATENIVIQDMISNEEAQRAEEVAKKYVLDRLKEVTETELWSERIGDEYEFDILLPSDVDYSAVCDGGDPKCYGLYVHVLTEYDNYHVTIEAKYNEEGDPIGEEELMITTDLR